MAFFPNGITGAPDKNPFSFSWKFIEVKWLASSSLSVFSGAFKKSRILRWCNTAKKGNTAMFEFFKKKSDAGRRPFTGAVIVAAGSSTRMGGIDKQLTEIGGKSVLARTLENFQKASSIDEIVVVTSEQLLTVAAEYVEKYKLDKVTHIVRGAASRQQSVQYGVTCLSMACRYVAVHDGARPFAFPALIDRVNAAAYDHGGAIAGIPVTSTVKTINADGFIEATIDRDALRLAQTPQTFKLSDYRKAADAARKSGEDYTDDSRMFETAGFRVALVEGDQRNIKLTTPADVLLAQTIAQKLDREETI